MIIINSLNSFKSKFIAFFVLLFLFSCEENKSLVVDPLDNIEYDFKVFTMDDQNSNSFRLDSFNSADSPRLYVGNISADKKSYIYLKIKNELLTDNLF